MDGPTSDGSRLTSKLIAERAWSAVLPGEPGGVAGQSWVVPARSPM